MSKRISKAVTLLALSVLSTLALAEAPARVGRIALAEGKVGISAQVGEETNAALVNWPVTSDNQITTERGARTEIKVGSTAIRVDGDSSLDVVELDDDSLRLHLHYGSVSIRVRNAEAMRGLEVSTPHGRVRLQEPGLVRIDAERQQDTSLVSVFDGVALVDGGGSTLTIRANRRAELRGDDIITGAAQRDGFDDWASLRDRRDERAVSERYVGAEMTGYEDLDEHGSWRDDAEYGPLWTPRDVPSGWVPYRDGRWTYLNTWGWTWVDNAPWGYAPFHYGRWVTVGKRWHWAPGREIGRPVWSPALVGWVGGAGWNASFNHGGGYRQAPAQGWYPLAPRDTFVPGYQLRADHLRYLNRHARKDGHDGRRNDHERRDRHGLTVVPHEHFGRRHQVVVPGIARANVGPQLAQQAPVAAPPAPVRVRRELTTPYVERHDGIRVNPRYSRTDGTRGREPDYRDNQYRQPAAVQPQVIGTQPQVIQTNPQAGFGYDNQRDDRERADRQRERQYEGQRRSDEARAAWRANREARANAPVSVGSPQPQFQHRPQVQPQPQPQPQPQQQGGGWAGAARQAMMASQREERARQQAPVYSAQPAAAVAMPQPMPQPVQAAPAPAAQPAQPSGRDEGPREARPGRHRMMQ